MNFLAHSYLSSNDEDILTGNMIADYVKGNIEKINLPKRIKYGIKIHRDIDSFTEYNEHSVRSKNRIDKKYGLYRGILIDIFYDHFLAKNWRDYSNQSLLEYTKNVYRILSRKIVFFPDKFKKVYYSMSVGNWLYSYKDIESIDKVLKSMSRFRIKRKNILNEGVAELKKHYVELENDFRLFFKEICYKFL